MLYKQVLQHKRKELRPPPNSKPVTPFITLFTTVLFWQSLASSASVTLPFEGSSSSSKHSNKSNKEKKGVRKSNKGGGGGGVRLSTDPQSVAARERRHRISDRFKILRSMVPGGSKMDTVSMLEGATHCVKFLKTQILLHQALIEFVDVNHHESPQFLPAEYNNFPDEHSISLQQNPSSSVLVHSHHQQQ